MRPPVLQGVPEDASADEKRTIDLANADLAVEFSIRKGRAVAAAAKVMPREYVRRLFTDYIESVDNLEGRTTGEQLFAIADMKCVRSVMEGLQSLCRLTVDEGKASASPSTSEPAPAAESSSSPAPSTESEAGTAPSIATETPAP
jgi:hypothetical protein